MSAILAVFLLIPVIAASATGADERPPERLWKASLVTLATASFLDAHSSWGKCESNSLLAGNNGRFNGRSVSIKGGMIAGLVLAETITGKRHPRLYSLFSAVNFSVGTGLGALAIHNYTIAPPAPGLVCH